MKKEKLIVMAGIMGLLMTGCGQGGQKAAENTAQTTAEATVETTAETTTETTTEATAQESPETSAESGKDASGVYEDNFSVDKEAAAAFGKQVKEAVAAKDLEKLADLTAFPVYLGLGDDGGPVESREEFLKIEADKIFTKKMLDSIAAADENSLEPSMAGFVLAGGNGDADIIFGVRDGVLAVTGING